MGFITVFVLVIVVVCILLIVFNLRVMKREESAKQANDENRMEQKQQEARQTEAVAVELETPVQDIEMAVEKTNRQPRHKELSRSQSTSSDNKMPDGHYRMALRQKFKPDGSTESDKPAQPENLSEDELYRSALRSMQGKEE